MKKSILTYGRFAVAATLMSATVFTACDSNQLLENQEVDAAQQKEAGMAGGQEMVPNEVLVKFKAGASAEARAAVLARISGRVKEKILTKAMERAGDKEGLVLVHTPMAALEAVAKARGLEVEYAEPNWIYTHDATSTDTYFTNGSLWGMYGASLSPTNNTFGSGASLAWENENIGSSSVVVGIIDEGIQITHPDLDDNIWKNPKEIPNNGKDDDGNNYVDDIYGWDFDGNNNTVYDGGTKGSLDDHGTHVAGTIGAKSNEIGVVGVNWNVTMISCKFLGRRGGSLANAVKALDYLTDLKSRHSLNLVASNNSWGGGGYSQALKDAITRSNAADILFIAAAGNGGSDQVGDNNDNIINYPSNYEVPNVIAVAAIDSRGNLGSFSNFGVKTVHIGAPGVGIWSTTAYNTYSSYSGTSMATPHVTGAAALYAASHSGASAAVIKAAILNSAVPTASLSGKCVTGGRLNASGF